MDRARVNGVELEYELRGTGQPVLLIHGSHVAGSFGPLLEQESLVDVSTLIRYHRRGFAGSTAVAGAVSIRDQAADASALLEYLGVRRAHVVGHSYGGAIALQLAYDAPSAVHSLVLLEAALLTVPSGQALIKLVAAATAFYRQGDWEVAVDPFLGGPQDRVDIGRRVPGGLDQAIRDMDTYFQVEAPAHEAWSFSAAEGRRIRQPTLFVLGSNSSPLYAECHDLVKEWMPQTETAVLPDATHLLQIQNPEGTAALLLDFIGRHPIPGPKADLKEGRAAMSTSVRSRDLYNATSDLLDHNLEQGRADKVAIRTISGDLTYAEVASSANRAGNALLDLGLEPENRVLMALLDSPEFASTFFGTIKAGGVPVPVNTNLTVDDFAYMLSDSRSKIAVVSQSVAEIMRQARRQVGYPQHLVVAGEPGRGELSLAEIVNDARDQLSPADTHRDDMCFWLYSSGTTGTPKGVVHLQHDMRCCVDAYARGVLGLDESDVTFSVSKLYFAYGLGNGLYFPFAVGATTVLLADPPTPRAVLEMTRRFQPTVYFSVPTSYANTLATGGSSWDTADFSRVRACVSAGEPLGSSVAKRWQERTAVAILDGIGSTECCHIFISNRLDDIRPDCSGTLVAGYDARVVDVAGQEVAAGEPGSLLVRGESVCAYYWRQHQRTKETILGEWLRTGDVYTRDETGHFFYQGRDDDMLKVGGIWVSPYEIENVLAAHANVVECAVLGLPDQDELIKPEAFVVLDGTGTDELEVALKQHVRQRLGGNKTPRAFHFVDSLPKTATGKIQRFKLREQIQKGGA
ncbi:MAG: benzoate-CoA ligase family protein [Candidatus Dormibacteraeota bacterium]|nr:benzoate-CoA ligase family protein [Candidatus Dormibacteraeota bacterium]